MNPGSAVAELHRADEEEKVARAKASVLLQTEAESRGREAELLSNTQPVTERSHTRSKCATYSHLIKSNKGRCDLIQICTQRRREKKTERL